jgi:hypothetical protein
MTHVRWFALGLLAMAVMIIVMVWYSHRVPTAPTTRRPPYGKPLLIDAPLYKQHDAAWGDERIGGSGQKIRSAGCTLCSMAMLLSHYGVEVHPGELNSFLKNSGGYTSTGLLVWDKCVEFAAGRIRLQYEGPPRQEIIERNLARGNPVIVKVLMHGRVQHWVLVVGTDGADYLINDPAGSSRAPGRLGTYGSYIYALRVFARTQAP